MADSSAGPMADRKRNDIDLYVTSLPQQTSCWPHQQDIVNKLFKVRTCLFDTETILWPADEDQNNLTNWFVKCASDHKCNIFYDIYFDYLDRALEHVDIDNTWWLNESQEDLDIDAACVVAKTVSAMENYRKNHSFSIIQDEVNRVDRRIARWLATLRTPLVSKPESICEKMYQECFKHLVEILELECHSGNFFSKMMFDYDYTCQGSAKRWKISSEPDILLYKLTENWKEEAVAVVEVKVDKALLKVTASKEEHENNLDGEGDHHDKERSEQDHCSLIKKHYPNGSIRNLTPEEKRQTAVFLPTLLGEIAGAVNTPLSNMRVLQQRGLPPGHRSLKSIIGFGVVGFKVYVVNFLCVARDMVMEERWRFHEVPMVRGMGVDILISEPLDMLKRSDRNKLFRIFGALKTLKYEKWET